MPRRFLEALAEFAWSLWGAPALDAAGDWPFLAFAFLCCLGGLALGGVGVMGWTAELRAPSAAGAPEDGGLRRAAWAAGRLTGVAGAATLALSAAWGLVCLARVAWISL